MGRLTPELSPDAEQLLHRLAEKEQKEGKEGGRSRYKIDDHLLKELGFDDVEALRSVALDPEEVRDA